MADLRIVDAPLLSTVKGTEKIPTGGEGNFSVSVNQVADFAKIKWFLATEEYVDNAVGNVQAALNLHKNNVSNPHQVTKEQVGLGNVDNTADLDKPVSNATQSAIITANSGKADKSYVDTQNNLKADKTYVDTQNNLKADKVDLTASKISSDSGQTQQTVNDFGGARWYEKSGGYELGATVKLGNGDTVKNTVPNNTKNPNIDMTGWVNPIKNISDNLARFRDVLDYMNNDGVSNVTAQLQALIATGGFWYIPEGVFNISTLFIPANTTIMTAGYNTVIQQVGGAPTSTRVICPSGSNIILAPALTIKGNIGTDTDEQNHAVFIQANAANGSINNVTIGDIHAENIRGDAIYFGQATGGQYKLSNISIGSVTGDNIYRNGVSVVSCNGFSINSIELTRVGMMDIDIEANIGSGVCRNGWIGYVKGKCIGGIAQTGADYVDNVTFDRVDLSFTNYIKSSPEYPSYYKIPVLVRNIKSMQINHLTIDGCDGLAISRISGDASLDDGKLKIGRLTLRNGAKTSDTYDAYINCSNVEVDFLDADLSTQAGKFIFTASNLAKVNQAKVSLNATSSFFRSCNDPIVSRLQVLNNDGIIFNGGLRGSILNSNITVNRLGSFADKLFIENCTVTSSNLFVNNTDHFIVNSTLNSIYFGSSKFIGAPVSKTYDPPSLTAAGTVGDSVTTTVTVNGATLGDNISVSFSQYNASVEISAQVSAVNTVTVKFKNTSASAVDMPSGTIKAKIT